MRRAIQRTLLSNLPITTVISAHVTTGVRPLWPGDGGAANPAGTPSLSRGRGEVGALWTRPNATSACPEVWGTVF